MPYIKRELRPQFYSLIEQFPNITNAGELNYIVSMICHKYLKDKGKSYQVLNDISGALTNANLELYRRITSPYEDEKIIENGDI